MNDSASRVPALPSTTPLRRPRLQPLRRPRLLPLRRSALLSLLPSRLLPLLPSRLLPLLTSRLLPLLPSRLLPVLLLSALFALSACEIPEIRDLNLIVEVRDEPISLGSDVGRVAVAPNTATASSSLMQTDLDIDRVEDLQKIGLEASFFTFTPSAGKVTEGNGTISIVVALNGVPLPQVIVVTIQNFAVTQVQPSAISFAGVTVDVDAISTVLASLPEEQRPNLKAWESMSLNQIVAEINAGLALSSFPFTIAIFTSGDLSGELKLNQFTIDAVVVA